MAWSETTRERCNRGSERYESDLTDGEWLLVEPLPSKPDRRSPRDPQRDPLHAGNGVPAAGDSQVLSAVCDGPEPLPCAARTGPRAGGAFLRRNFIWGSNKNFQ